MKTIILASGSPRRHDLLTAMGVSFQTIPSNYDEHLDSDRSPEIVAAELGLGKALDVAAQYPDAFVIGSDTIVTINGKQLGKPEDAEEARQTLHGLSGTVNKISTSAVVVCQSRGIQLVGCETAKVFFKPLDTAAINAYVATGKCMDKAGSYGIQDLEAALLIDHFEGDYDTILGLPTTLLAQFLSQLDIPAQAVILEAPIPKK